MNLLHSADIFHNSRNMLLVKNKFSKDSNIDVMKSVYFSLVVKRTILGVIDRPMILELHGSVHCSQFVIFITYI